MFGVFIRRQFQSTRPLRGATSYSSMMHCTSVRFQSTRPLRGATPRFTCFGRGLGISIHAPLAGRDDFVGDEFAIVFISIHAPLAGRDRSYRGHNPQYGNFNPRAPCGARPVVPPAAISPTEFQSTRPLRGATALTCCAVMLRQYFNPRAPCGARLQEQRDTLTRYAISIHAPLAGRDLSYNLYKGDDIIFQSTRPLRGATASNGTTDI